MKVYPEGYLIAEGEYCKSEEAEFYKAAEVLNVKRAAVLAKRDEFKGKFDRGEL